MVFYDDDLHARRFPTWGMQWVGFSSFAGIELLISTYPLLKEDGWAEKTILFRLVDTLSAYQQDLDLVSATLGT